MAPQRLLSFRDLRPGLRSTGLTGNLLFSLSYIPQF